MLAPTLDQSRLPVNRKGDHPNRNFDVGNMSLIMPGLARLVWPLPIIYRPAFAGVRSQPPLGPVSSKKQTGSEFTKSLRGTGEP